MAALTGALPPVARLALVFSGGAALAFLPGRFSLPGLFVALCALLPMGASHRPAVRAALGVALCAGLLTAVGAGTRPPPHPAAASEVSGVAGVVQGYRDGLVRRVTALYGPQAPLVSALVLAERRGLDPRVRDAFARSGTAHLLAISGFHVGVIAGMLFALVRGMGLPRRRASLVAAGGAWSYVALLGFPDAASRAALILTVVAASQARGRPAARWGGLGTALLMLVVLEPARLLSPGFQLSFAGAAGLVGWGGPLTARLRRIPHFPRSLARPVATGVAATVATLPLVAWHFERVSLVGVPATLFATPFVVMALPGALISLLADALHPPLGRFFAGGVGLALALLARGTAWVAEVPWASAWLSRGWVTVATAGVVVASMVARSMVGPGRRAVWAAGALAGIVAWPGVLVLQARGTAEVVVVDVGQGDAVAVRSPRGRWILVDAGPPWRGDAGSSPLVRALRRRGVTTLDMLVLTHPDLDHIGGGLAVLSSFAVAEIYDPAWPTGKGAYLELQEAAARAGTPWHRARVGDVRHWDGIEVRTLHPGGDGDGREGEGDANDRSVVVSLRYGDFDALLTGDAPVAVERAVLPGVSGTLEVLKVGHHGSATSTDPLLLRHARPRLALISVGRRNLYGHPHPEVVRRLSLAGAEVRRTDTDGTLSVLGRPDGSFLLRAEGTRRR